MYETRVTFEKLLLSSLKIAARAASFVLGIVTINHDLRAFSYHCAVFESRVENGFFATATNRFHLLERMRDFHQSLAAGKGARLKIGSNAIGQHRGIIQHGGSQCLIYLRRAQKLGFVDEDTIKAIVRRCLSRKSKV